MIPQEAPLTAQITITGYLPSAKVAEIRWPDTRITNALVKAPAHLEQLINRVFIGHPVEAELELRPPTAAVTYRNTMRNTSCWTSDPSTPPDNRLRPYPGAARTPP